MTLPAKLTHFAIGTALGLSAVLAPPVPAQSNQVTVEYLANEGVLLSSGTTQVLIDGLFGDGLPDYPVVQQPVRDSLERALGRFGGIDLVLATHIHDDHFSAASMARHLRANPGAHVVVAPQLRTALASAGWSDPPRTTVITPDPAVPGRVMVAGLAVEGHGIPHAGVDHLVWVVELAGLRIMHAGDSDPSPAELGRAAASGIDLLLAPFWILMGRDGPERIAATRARRVAAFHSGHRDRFSTADGVLVLDRPGMRFELLPR
jgi:L-ascorbate metabolism protein UlaG (beta-lactamase superfamily)